MSQDAPHGASSDVDPMLARIAAIVGEGNVLVAAGDVAPYLVEWRGLFTGRTRAVVRPKDTAEVSAIMRLCHEHGIPVVPQGGNTGLVGGQTPDGSGTAIVLSLTRMNRVRELDLASDAMTVDAGLTLLAAQEAADAAGRLFPLS